MRLARKALNWTLGELLRDESERAKRIDRTFFRCLSIIGRVLGIRNAERLGENWAPDAARILFESVLTTPYGDPLVLTLPLMATLEITNACPMGCRICYSDSVARPKAITRLAINLVEKLARTKIPVFFLTGGEPLEHPDIGSVIECLLRHGKMVTVATATYKPRLTEILTRYPNRVTFLFSIWGDSATHDSIRGEGNYAATVRHLQRLAGLPVVTSINYVVSRPHTNPIAGLESLLHQVPTIRRAYLSREISVGRFTDNGHLDGKALKRIRSDCRTLIPNIRRKLVWGIPESTPAETPLSIRNLTLALVGVRPPKGCGAANWVMHVDASGGVSPCPAHGQCWGNIENQEIEDLWKTLQERRNNELIRSACAAEELAMAKLASNRLVTLKAMKGAG